MKKKSIKKLTVLSKIYIWSDALHTRDFEGVSDLLSLIWSVLYCTFFLLFSKLICVPTQLSYWMLGLGGIMLCHLIGFIMETYVLNDIQKLHCFINRAGAGYEQLVRNLVNRIPMVFRFMISTLWVIIPTFIFIFTYCVAYL